MYVGNIELIQATILPEVASGIIKYYTSDNNIGVSSSGLIKSISAG